MGGLRSKIPWTFWTMTAGTVAIAGIPPLAGFFSKDEILWRAYHASWIYWFLGLVTALLTSFYMFRLWFLTFFGEYRGTQASPSGHGAGHGTTGGQGHSGIHESPRVMLVPLVLLAVLSVVGGWVGVPGSLGGSDRFGSFLAPVLHSTLPRAGDAAARPDLAAQAQTEGPEPQGSGTTELLFTGVSVLVALAGFFFAWLLYFKNPRLPQQIADSLGALYQTVVHKYYVDEIYAALFVKPLVTGSTRILWQGIDRDIIDQSVDQSADGARELSDGIRHMQSGNVRSYAGWVALGAAAVIAYMIWTATR